jgi:hypothetical protein
MALVEREHMRREQKLKAPRSVMISSFRPVVIDGGGHIAMIMEPMQCKKDVDRHRSWIIPMLYLVLNPTPHAKWQ